MAKKTQQAPRDLVSRGVDRVPARYRVAPPRPTWIHLHTSPSRLMVRLTAASRGELNVPYVNPGRDAKSLRSGRLRKELQP